ncbi:MAG: CoA-binding protein [Myxococcota bacterium]
MRELTAVPDLRRVLEEARTIAVLGATPRVERAGHYVPAYLQKVGYRVFPVNPSHAGETLFGERVRASLSEIDEPIDVIDVFRRPERLYLHTREILELDPKPRTVWLQLGIQHPGFAQDMIDHGIEIVQGRCMLTDHRAWGIPPVSP